MDPLYDTATVFVANELTITRGTVDDITAVGVYHDTDPNVVPTVEDFTPVLLVQPGDPLAEGEKVDVLSLIGSKVGADLALAGSSVGVDYQRWALVQTAQEDVIIKVDTVTVKGNA